MFHFLSIYIRTRCESLKIVGVISSFRNSPLPCNTQNHMLFRVALLICNRFNVPCSILLHVDSRLRVFCSTILFSYFYYHYSVCKMVETVFSKAKLLKTDKNWEWNNWERIAMSHPKIMMRYEWKSAGKTHSNWINSHKISLVNFW